MWAKIVDVATSFVNRPPPSKSPDAQPKHLGSSSARTGFFSTDASESAGRRRPNPPDRTGRCLEPLRSAGPAPFTSSGAAASRGRSPVPPPVHEERSAVATALMEAFAPGDTLHEQLDRLNRVVERQPDEGAMLRALGKVATELGRAPRVDPTALLATALWTQGFLGKLAQQGRVKDAQGFEPMGLMLFNMYADAEKRMGMSGENLVLMARGQVENHFLQLAANALEKGSVSYDDKSKAARAARSALNQSYIEAVVQGTLVYYANRSATPDDRHRALLTLRKSLHVRRYSPLGLQEEVTKSALNVARLTHSAADLEGSAAHPRLRWYALGCIFKDAVAYIHEHRAEFEHLRESMGIRPDEATAFPFMSQAILCFNNGLGDGIPGFAPDDAAWRTSQHGTGPINTLCCLEIAARIQAEAHKRLLEQGLTPQKAISPAGRTPGAGEADHPVDFFGFTEHGGQKEAAAEIRRAALELAQEFGAGARFGASFVQEAAQLLSNKGARQREAYRTLLAPLLAVEGDDVFVGQQALAALRADYCASVVCKALEAATWRAEARELLAHKAWLSNPEEHAIVFEHVSKLKPYAQGPLVAAVEKLRGRAAVRADFLKVLAANVFRFEAELPDKVAAMLDKLGKAGTDAEALSKALEDDYYDG